MRFEGIYPPVITPHREDYSIDHDKFVEVIEHLIASKVHGLIVGGTTGEYYAHTPDERVGLMRFAKETINGRLPLICGVGATRTEDCCAFAEEARALGGDAILINSPPYAVPDQSELAAHALAIDRAANLPIILYNYPGRTGTLMQAEFFDRVGRSPNFAAIKESSGDINQLHMLARDYRHITLLCGMDDQALEFYAWGAAGWVCAGGNCLPREHIALHDACFVENDFRKGRRIMSAMLPLMRVLEQGGKFVQSVKYICELEGLPAGAVRRPLRPLRKENKRELENVVRTLKRTIAAITSESRSQGESNVVALDARGI